ncbi:MAG: signal transduction histidine kinase/CheY-like chemotaxis protein [Marinoscillum sp.]|jgi:signal transduction histidine kinase/CheY-like chemotaxis protein/ligand-binding sensor domain-containing protein/AraC-like DNA-binding protein
MSSQYIRVIFLLLIATKFPTVYGQGEWPLQQIDKRSGLSNSAINAIYFDSNDHVWFGTWDGLNYYNGDKIVSYKPQVDDDHSISNNIVRQILEDKNGNLWVVTHDGINRYDRKLDRFHRYLHDIEDLPFLENNLQATLYDDSLLYVSLVGWGIGRYSPDEDQFVRIHQESQLLKNTYTLGSHEKNIYLLGDSTLNVLDAEGEVTSHRINWSSNMALGKLIGMDGRYFLIYQPNPNLLELLELNGNEIIANHEVQTAGMLITSIAQSQDKMRLYLGTDEGKLLLLSMNNNSIKMTSFNEQLSSLQEKKLKIFSVHESRQNLLWVGTDGDGVYKYLTKKRSFHTISEGNASEGKISNSIVRSIYADKSRLFIGTRSGGLNVINMASAETKIYNKSNGLNDNTVLSLAKDDQGNMWVGMDGEGLDMIEKETGRIYHFPEDFKNETNGLSFGSVYKIFFDVYGQIWLGTSGNGVIFLDIEKDKNGAYLLKESYAISPEEDDRFGKIRMKSNIVYSIVEEEPNILWFGSRNGGLYRYNSILRQFTHILQADTKSEWSISNNDILSLYIDRKSRLWVGTSGGLNEVSLNNYKVQQYTQIDGLANNTIHGILEDYAGRLWLSSNNGLFAFNPEQNTFKNYNWNDGLLNFEYTDGAYFQTSVDDRLYFGGTNGVDMVYPARLDTSTNFQRLALTDLYVFNQRIHPGDSSHILPQHIDQQKEISLNYDQNYLSLRFTTLDYWHKQRCKYRYYLEGFDKGWIDLGKQSVINLTNIPPGQYTLHLNNSNENGDWNPEVRLLAINISPPFWASHAAYFIYFLSLLLAQVALFQFWRNRAKRRKADEINRLKQEQSVIIQKYKLEFFTNIAHEFRTPLTLILGPAASLLDKTKAVPALHQPIQSIYRNSLRLQKLIQELVQFRKVELGKEQLRIRSLNLIMFVDELLQSFKQYALDKEIALKYDAPSSLVVNVDTEILEKILINLISNALKYTEAGGEVYIKISSGGGRIYFSVSDTGIGIHADEIDRVFERFSKLSHDSIGQAVNSAGIGLSLTQKLINLHQGDISVESQPGEGSDFSFWLPSDLSKSEDTMMDDVDEAMMSSLHGHVEAELYHDGNLVQEMINISLERFEHNILIVDDNVQILSLLKQLLSSKYNTIACANGQEALKVLLSRKIDLVISDVIMPEMDGYTLCETIKSKIETSHIPVILLTAKGELEERIEGLHAGADAYIPKPFHPEHLYVRVEKLIKTREVLKNKFEAYEITESEMASFGIGARDDDFFKKVDQFIKDEMANPQLDAMHIANHVAISKTSLYKKVKALTGLTPHAMINQYRLKKAAYLLTNTDLNVSEIINKTGFNSRSYFYKSFLEMFQCSPSSYGDK